MGRHAEGGDGIDPVTAEVLVDAAVDEALELFRARRFDEARARLEDARPLIAFLEPRPRARFHSMRVHVEGVLGDFEAARASCEAIIEIEDDLDAEHRPGVHLMHAWMLERLGDWDGARVTLDRAVPDLPAVDPARRCEIECERAKVGIYLDDLAYARTAITGAKAVFAEVDGSERFALAVELSKHLRGLDEWDEAHSFLDPLVWHASELDQDLGCDFLEERATVLYMRGEFEGAEASIEGALRASRGRPPEKEAEIRRLYAVILAMRSRYAEAVEIIAPAVRNAATFHPHLRATILTEQASLLFHLDDERAALRCIEDVLPLTATLPLAVHVGAHLTHSRILRALDEREAARATLESVLDAIPRLTPLGAATLLTEYGHILHVLGEPRAGLERLREARDLALRLHPVTQAQLLLEAARAFLAYHDLPSAREAIEEAASLHEAWPVNDHNILQMRVIVRNRQGEHEAVVDLLTSADPPMDAFGIGQEAGLRSELAIALAALGREEAHKEIRWLIENDPWRMGELALLLDHETLTEVRDRLLEIAPSRIMKEHNGGLVAFACLRTALALARAGDARAATWDLALCGARASFAWTHKHRLQTIERYSDRAFSHAVDAIALLLASQGPEERERGLAIIGAWQNRVVQLEVVGHEAPAPPSVPETLAHLRARLRPWDAVWLHLHALEDRVVAGIVTQASVHVHVLPPGSAEALAGHLSRLHEANGRAIDAWMDGADASFAPRLATLRATERRSAAEGAPFDVAGRTREALEGLAALLDARDPIDGEGLGERLRSLCASRQDPRIILTHTSELAGAPWELILKSPRREGDARDLTVLRAPSPYVVPPPRFASRDWSGVGMSEGDAYGLERLMVTSPRGSIATGRDASAFLDACRIVAPRSTLVLYLHGEFAEGRLRLRVGGTEVPYREFLERVRALRPAHVLCLVCQGAFTPPGAATMKGLTRDLLASGVDVVTSAGQLLLKPVAQELAVHVLKAPERPWDAARSFIEATATLDGGLWSSQLPQLWIGTRPPDARDPDV